VVFVPIKRVVPQGIELDTGEVIQLDAIVCATGFNVSWKPRFPIIGRGGVDMRDQWSSRPTAYLSLAVPNFPNYICEWLQEAQLDLPFIDTLQCIWVQMGLFRTGLPFQASNISHAM
jgi:cation diffusion facilitator CzcD-associated flavoprotein CzcO